MVRKVKCRVIRTVPPNSLGGRKPTKPNTAMNIAAALVDQIQELPDGEHVPYTGWGFTSHGLVIDFLA